MFCPPVSAWSVRYVLQYNLTMFSQYFIAALVTVHLKVIIKIENSCLDQNLNLGFRLNDKAVAFIHIN